jgi:hypothetical protein
MVREVAGVDLLSSRKGPPLGAPGQIALAKIETSRAIKSVPDAGEQTLLSRVRHET